MAKKKPTTRKRGAAAAAEPRRPLQQRGERRVETILDAAGAMIAEQGIAAVGMHGIAKRSGTTVGSMYHFFPDLSSVIAALAERHARGVRERLETLDSAGVDWSKLSTPAAIDQFLDPILGYIADFPDVLEVMRHTRAAAAKRDEQVATLMLDLARRVVESRHPSLSPPERLARAATMMAVIDGVVRRTAETGAPSRRAMLGELKRVLVAYTDAG